MSGWIPICRNWPTECCVGLVFNSPAAFRYGTSVRWMYRQFSLPTSSENWRMASRNGWLSMSPTVPPISVITTSTSSSASLRMHGLDLVGDVRNHLHGLAQELAAPLLVDHRQVDLAGGVVRVARQRAVGEPLVVAQVEVGLAAVVQHVDFAVLVGAHRAGIDVDVRVELLHPHPQAALLRAACRSRRWSAPCPAN